VPRSPKNGRLYDKILLIESPKNGRIYGLLWKPVDVGDKTVTDGLARNHRIAQKRAILWKCILWHITHSRNFGFWAILWKPKFHNTNHLHGDRIAQKWAILRVCCGTKGLINLKNLCCSKDIVDCSSGHNSSWTTVSGLTAPHVSQQYYCALFVTILHLFCHY
jgi:hypothetical protein